MGTMAQNKKGQFKHFKRLNKTGIRPAGGASFPNSQSLCYNVSKVLQTQILSINIFFKFRMWLWLTSMEWWVKSDVKGDGEVNNSYIWQIM